MLGRKMAPPGCSLVRILFLLLSVSVPFENRIGDSSRGGGALEPSFLPPFLLRYERTRHLENRIMDEGGSNTPFSGATTLATTAPSTANGLQKGEKESAIDAEVARLNKLPAHSSYAMHRMKVLNKLRHLLSIKRTTSQDEELELLFASLSI